MAYQYPYGDTQQLNLAWFLDEFKALQKAWEQEKQGITGALDAEIARAEAALSGVIEARDQAAASAADALAYRNAAQSASQAAELSKSNAETARRDASNYAVSAAGSAQNASNSAIAAGNSATLAESAKSTAIQQANAAVQASGAASGYAQTAGQEAANAAASATAADGSATAAAGSATTAGEEADRAEAAADEVADSVTQIATNTSDINSLKESFAKNITDKMGVVSPDNWLNLTAITDGELLADGTVSESTTRFYTDFIPVEQGNKMQGYRAKDPINAVYRRHICLYDEDKSVVSGGSDSSNNGAFTIPENVSYCRMTFDKNILDLKPVIVNDGVAPTRYTAYFEPYEIYTEDFLTPESKEAVQKIINKDLSTTDLDNRYSCALPKTILRQTVGLPESWYYSSCVSPLTPVDINAGTLESQRENEKISFPNLAALDSTNGYYYIVQDLLLADINSYRPNSGYGLARKIITENLQNCSALVIGDSTVDFDTMTQYMLDYFTSKEKTLTLIGTLGSGDNKNEGRAGWKAVDYLTNKTYDGTVNPFYNPTTETFDFAYYMQTQNYSAPDFVIIQLGINDLYNYGLYAIEPTWQAIKTIIDSIRTYSTAIKILLNLPTTPNSDQSKHSVFLTDYKARIITYNEYAQEQVRTTYNFDDVRCSYCHLILDPDSDIRDGVHPTDAGFEKMAKEVINQINCWQNGV